jgi:hypothetical protein
MFSYQDTRKIPLNKTIYAITANASKHLSCTPQMQQTSIHELAHPTCVLLQILIPLFSSILFFISNSPCLDIFGHPTSSILLFISNYPPSLYPCVHLLPLYHKFPHNMTLLDVYAWNVEVDTLEIFGRHHSLWRWSLKGEDH